MYVSEFRDKMDQVIKEILPVLCLLSNVSIPMRFLLVLPAVLQRTSVHICSLPISIGCLKIVNNPQYPVQFIFSGKARHPADGAGQDLIKRIVEISRRPEFLGKIIFLENYDMKVAKRLVSGVDIWLNTPTRPLEASGTSGEKAEMNGVLNFSVLDGWWYEGYKEGAGWALTDKLYLPRARQSGSTRCGYHPRDARKSNRSALFCEGQQRLFARCGYSISKIRLRKLLLSLP